MKFDAVKYIDGRVQRFAFAKPLVTRKPFTFSQSPQAIPGMIGQDKVFDGSELGLSEIAGKTVKASEKLPSGYTEVEYLESTGTQFINTNYFANSSDEIEVVFEKSPGFTVYDKLFGSQDHGAGIQYFFIGFRQTGIYDIGFNLETHTTTSWEDGVKKTLKFKNGDLYIDGIIAGSSSSKYQFGTSSFALYIFAMNRNNVGIENSTAKIYSFKVKKDDESIACDFIPCKRTSDNKAGFYDVARGQFFQNAGTGEFITGDDVFDTLKSAEVSGVQVNGANLWDEEWELGDISYGGGTNITSSSWIRSKNYCRISPNANFYIETNTKPINVFFYDSEYNYLGYKQSQSTGVKTSLENASYFRIAQNSTTYNHDIAIVLGSTGAYKPYRAPWLFDIGETVTLNGAGAVGDKISIVAKENGRFDVVKTTKFAEKEIVCADVSEASYSYNNIKYFTIPKPTDYIGRGVVTGNYLLSRYPAGDSVIDWDNAGKIGKIYQGATYNNFWVGYAVGTLIAEARQDLVGAKLVYELATPTTTTLLSDLTRDEITALVETYGSIEIVGNDNQRFVQPTVTVNIDAQSQTEIQKFSVDIPKPADPVFANNDWPTILSNFKKGTAPATWQVGDTKPLTLTDGTTYTIRLCDKQEGRYDYSDGSGSSKAVFEFVELVKVGSTNGFQMNATNTNAGGWASSYMRGTNIPSIEALIPNDVLTAISEVDVLSSSKIAGGTSSSTNKLFLPAEMEMFSLRIYSIGTIECPLGQFDYYKANNTQAKKVKKVVGTTTARPYWLRSPHNSGSSSFCAVGSTGSYDYSGASLSYGVSPIFAV